MTDLIEVKTSDLVGEQLAWAVATAEGLDVQLGPPQYGNPWRVFVRRAGEATTRVERYNPQEDWSLGGPLIDEHQALIGTHQIPGLTDKASARLHYNGKACWQSGSTALIAMCRTVVAAKLGDTVQVPKELML